MKDPKFAGQFYEKGFSELDRQIRACFMHKLGPGEIPSAQDKKRSKVVGAIVPHAGYDYSGMCASWVYKEISESPKPHIFVIIGPNHSGFSQTDAKVSISLEDQKTPFGVVQINKRFAKTLIASLDFAENDEMAFLREHSVEVQLPFLQFIAAKKFSLEIVPILVKDLSFDECRHLADSIDKASEDLNVKIIVIASTDFTHYGASYGYIPFIDDIKNKMYGVDASAIEFIQKMDSKGFYNHIKEYKMTVCGYVPATIALEVAKLHFAKKSKLLSYYTSGDITGSYRSAVGYAGIVFE